MNATFDTTEFEFAHGRKPRGFGEWCFQDTATKQVFTPRGNFGTAKRLAATEAKESRKANGQQTARFTLRLMP